MPIPMPPAWKPIGGLKPLETEAPMGPIMGLGEGKAAMVVPCTGAGRAVLPMDRLFREVMLLSRLLVRSLVCKRKEKHQHQRALQQKHWALSAESLTL